MSSSQTDVRLRRWQHVTAGSLFVGYAGYYLGRSCLAIATPLMIDAGPRGLTMKQIGDVASAGVVTYAIGKVINGLLVDYLGGRRMFLFGMAGTVACTAVFGLSSTFWAFLAVWGISRFFQSMGWNALVKTASRWFPADRQTLMMGILSASFLIGDALNRLYLGGLVEIGQRSAGPPLDVLADWRSVFLVAAATLAVVGIVIAFVLRSSPGDLGLPEPSANPQNVFGDGGQLAQAVPLAELLLPFFQSPLFWAICGISFGMTLIRESFNNWSSIYLKQVAGLSSGQAGIASLVFPFVGGFSAIAAGLLSNRLGGRHGRVVVPSLVALIGALCLLGSLDVRGRPIAAMALVGGASFFLIGPYSYLSGVMALDLGGKRGSSTAAGLIDGAGYLGAIASGRGVAAVADRYQWHGVFQSLAGVCCLTLIVAVAYLILNERVRSSAVEAADGRLPNSPQDESKLIDDSGRPRPS